MAQHPRHWAFSVDGGLCVMICFPSALYPLCGSSTLSSAHWFYVGAPPAAALILGGSTSALLCEVNAAAPLKRGQIRPARAPAREGCELVHIKRPAPRRARR
jgi:hypothetical protein